MVGGPHAKVHRRVDVEAVDVVGGRRRSVAQLDAGAVGQELGGVEIGGAGVAPPRKAEPLGRVAVVRALVAGERAVEVRRRGRALGGGASAQPIVAAAAAIASSKELRSVTRRIERAPLAGINPMQRRREPSVAGPTTCAPPPVARVAVRKA